MVSSKKGIIHVLVSFIVLFIFYAFSIQSSYAQTCSVPAQVQNVQVTYPSCVGSSCNFTQASCTWSSVSGATGYQVVISEVETNTTIQNQQVDASTTSNIFPVTQTNTYNCSVSAINSCGTGTAGTGSLLCKVDAQISAAPTAIPAPTTAAPNTIYVTATPAPQKMLVAGNNDIVWMGMASFVLIGIGFSMFLL